MDKLSSYQVKPSGNKAPPYTTLEMFPLRTTFANSLKSRSISVFFFSRSSFFVVDVLIIIMAAIRFFFSAAHSSVAMPLMVLSSCVDFANIFIPVRVKVCSPFPVLQPSILSKQINSISSVIFAAQFADGMNEWKKRRFSSNLPLISSVRFSPML